MVVHLMTCAGDLLLDQPGERRLLACCGIGQDRERRLDGVGKVAGLHPGTVATDLSAPFQKGMAEGKLFPADYSAERLLTVLSNLTPADSGGVFAWDGARVPE